MRPFLVLSTPRSGTAWIANWLTHQGVYCYHELFGEPGVTSVEDVALRLREDNGLVLGNSDSGNIWFLEQLRGLMPDVVLVAVTRPVEDVYRSLERAIVLPEEVLQAAWESLLELSECLSYAINEYGLQEETFGELFTVPPEVSIAAGRRIWDTVSGGRPFDEDRWLRLRRMNVQLTSEALDSIFSRAPYMRHLLETRDEYTA